MDWQLFFSLIICGLILFALVCISFAERNKDIEADPLIEEYPHLGPTIKQQAQRERFADAEEM